MSINLNNALGEAIVQACERAGFIVWADEGSAQVRIRDALADPKDNSTAERARAAAHTPRQLPQGLSSDLNNKRGSVLSALIARRAAARAADPVATEAAVPTPVPAANPGTMPKGIIRQPGFGDTQQRQVKEMADEAAKVAADPVQDQLSPQTTAVIEETAAAPEAAAAESEDIPGNPSLDPFVDPLLNDVSL